jgi:N-acetylmuramic acid 6-phosphate etherase
LIAGTGMIVYGENEQGDQARAGGWGFLLDQGGGYRLALDALRAICRANDGLAQATSLTGRVLASLELAQVGDLIRWLYASERPAADIAALAPLVLAEAEAGDGLAVEIIARSADALAEAVDAVARRLGVWAQPTPLVLAGSLLTQNSFYRGLVSQAVQTRIPHCRPRLPQADPATGAALLALEGLGYPLPGPATPPESPSDIWSSEQRNLLTEKIDLQPALTLAGLMHIQDQQAVAAVGAVLPAIAQAIEEIAQRMGRGGRLIYAGAGTSGRLGILDAVECPPTFNSDPAQVIGLIAGGPAAMSGAIEGAEDDALAGATDVAKLGVGPNDSLVGLAASGRTPYARGALQAARQRGALTIALTCNLPAPIAEVAERVIAPLVGPEAITGSTRLKAGTAQKLVLNMLSTGVMLRLGKSYGNLMVDVRPSNAKLQNRARRIVAQACGLAETDAAALLARCQGEVKTAIVCHLAGCAPDEARARLARAAGVVRAALRR